MATFAHAKGALVAPLVDPSVAPLVGPLVASFTHVQESLCGCLNGPSQASAWARPRAPSQASLRAPSRARLKLVLPRHFGKKKLAEISGSVSSGGVP